MSQLKAGVGASDTLFQHDRPNKPNRSRFNMSRITNFTLDPGMIVPFDWLFCLPGDDIDIDFEYILDTLPLVNPSLTSYKVLTHWYFIDAKKLWEGWQTFITRGRSGNINLTIPQLQINYPLSSDYEVFPWTDSNDSIQVEVFPFSQHSLSSFLGVPPSRSGILKGLKSESDGSFHLSTNYLPYSFYAKGDNVPDKMSSTQRASYNKLNFTGFNEINNKTVSALPFMAYQNIVKYNYVNQNLLQNNHSLFPVKGDHDWFLRYNATTTNWLDFDSNTDADVADPADKVFSIDGVFSDSDTATRLDLLRYAQFDDDYFTTGLPWLQRGSVTEAGMDITIENFPEKFKDLFSGTDSLPSVLDLDFSGQSLTKPDSTRHGWKGVGNKLIGEANVSYDYGNEIALSENNFSTFVSALKNLSTTVSSSLSATASLTANQLREMIAMSVWQERNARVNGSYNSMIYQHWLSNPHAEEHKPDYIGGTADTIAFSTILQSSQSTSDSPLGSTAGRGSSGGSARVGRYHANDYGYLFGIMIVKPNTTYMQGVEHHLTEKVFDDFVQPEFEGLSPQPILNKELYISGNSSDEDLLCYQERYVYLKVRQNQNRGMFQCKPDKDRLFGSFTQARWFDSKPTFSYQFLCMSPDNMRRDWLAYPSMPAFKVQAASKIYVTRALSYTSQPNTFGF